MDQQPAAFEPIVVRDAVFYVERLLDEPGEVIVRAADRVTPDTEVATAMVSAGRPLTLHVSRELGVEPETVGRYLTKPIGSTFQEGEQIARARRGLRSAVCTSPVAATLTALDQSTGVVTLIPKNEPQHVFSTVYGEVESIHERRGVTVRVNGSRVQGFLGLGEDTFGPLKIAADRPDRELTADMVDPEFRNAIVLGGMTLGTSTMRRLIDVGARGVIVGSISDTEIRRFLSHGDNEPPSILVWRSRARDLELGRSSGGRPFSVFVTEGFGRRRMAQPIFQFLTDQEDQMASILIPQDNDLMRARPSLYISSDRSGGEDALQRVHIRPGTTARLADPQHLGIVVTCRSGVLEDPGRAGRARDVVLIELANGTRRIVPAANLEVIQ
jgi:hypothetical protein